MSTDTLMFCCLILREKNTSRNIFVIRIALNEYVDILKDRIKDKVLPDAGYPANRLVLWKVSIPCDNIESSLETLKLDGNDIGVEELNPAWRLSKRFSEPLPEDTIHILVQLPVTGDRHNPLIPSHTLTYLQNDPRFPFSKGLLSKSMTSIIGRLYCPHSAIQP